MGFHIDGTKLRVFRKFANEERNSSVLKDSRFIVLEHILPTTLEMLNLLRSVGADIFSVVAKPYSIDEKVLKSLESDGINVIKETYDNLETTPILVNLIKDAIKECENDKRRLVILDVGGYFAKPLVQMSEEKSIGKYLMGVVEDTTFGHNRYLVEAPKISIPIFSVARSYLKEIEARFVGHDAVKAADILLREVGSSIVGRNALVIGYGMIGKNVARSLKSYDASVSVYDKLDTRNLQAFIDGYAINKKADLLKMSDIIFLATGDPSGALSIDEILEIKSGVVLASVGSKDTEFDLKSLKSQAVATKNYGEQIDQYSTNHSRKIVILKQGTAVNFYLPSIPIEVLDLVFSEIFLCAMRILKKEGHTIGKVHEVEEKALQPIAHDWLRFINS